jgi:hypothetical protein
MPTAFHILEDAVLTVALTVPFCDERITSGKPLF